MEDKHGRTAVHLAATRNHCDVIQFLLEHGIELDSMDVEGKTPAHYAAACGNVECLKLLVDNAIDIVSGDHTEDQPIHDAAKNNQIACLKLLLKKGAKLHATDNHNRGLLHKVCVISNMSILISQLLYQAKIVVDSDKCFLYRVYNLSASL